MAYYLRMGSDYLDDACKFATKSDALYEFERTARELDRYGQRIEASLHIADSKDDLQEYPDFVLSLGPRGGLRCERA
jgi:hypothetical protein